MELNFIAYVQTDTAGYGYVAWFDKIKGITVQADSIESAVEALLNSMKVKISFEYGVPIDSINVNEFDSQKTAAPKKTFGTQSKVTTTGLSFAVA